jgi:hypothetical protein
MVTAQDLLELERDILIEMYIALTGGDLWQSGCSKNRVIALLGVLLIDQSLYTEAYWHRSVAVALSQ